jgi:hypothetical protein
MSAVRTDADCDTTVIVYVSVKWRAELSRQLLEVGILIWRRASNYAAEILHGAKPGRNPLFKPLHLLDFVNLGATRSFNLYSGAFGLADQRASNR